MNSKSFRLKFRNKKFFHGLLVSYQVFLGTRIERKSHVWDSLPMIEWLWIDSKKTNRNHVTWHGHVMLVCLRAAVSFSLFVAFHFRNWLSFSPGSFSPSLLLHLLHFPPFPPPFPSPCPPPFLPPFPPPFPPPFTKHRNWKNKNGANLTKQNHVWIFWPVIPFSARIKHATKWRKSVCLNATIELMLAPVNSARLFLRQNSHLLSIRF